MDSTPRSRAHRDLTLVEIIPVDGVDADDVICLVGALEQTSEHPIGRALTAAALQRLGELPGVRNLVRIPGLGLCGTVAGHLVLAGRRALLAGAGWALPSDLLLAAADAREHGRTPVFTGWGGRTRALVVLDRRLPDLPSHEPRAGTP